MAKAEPAPPRWAVLTSAGLAAAGLAASTYLTVEHYRSPGTLACPANATFNCAAVTTSEQATLLGLPVALLGVGYFLAILALCWPTVWRVWTRPVVWARAGLAGVGAVFVLYLVYVELLVVNAICLWCTAVHIIALALFGVISLATALLPPARR